MRVLVAAVLLAACTPSRGTADAPLGNTHIVRAPPSPGPRLRTTMRAHYGDLRYIRTALLAGRLGEARALATWLVRAEMARGDEMREAARALQAAPTLTSAIHASARIAGACGRCHARARARVFDRDGLPPAGRTARHRWATDRVWDGMIAASDTRLESGLAVLAEDPRLGPLASRALASPRDKRDTVLGELLVACTSCHR